MRQHVVGGRARRRHHRVWQAATAQLSVARRLRQRHRVPQPSCVGRCSQALGSRLHRADSCGCRRAHCVRTQGHCRHGVQQLLPHRVGPHQVREGQRHSGGSRPRFGGRLRSGVLPAYHRTRSHPIRPAVRALLEPKPRQHARHRHGLRLALSRRDDPLCHREIRARSRCADHYLWHHQGAQRRARRGPRAWLSLRHGRQDREGNAAVGHGSRHAAQVLLRAEPKVRRRIQSRHRAARDVRNRPRHQAGCRCSQGPRRSQAKRWHPRRRSGDYQRSAHHVSAGAAQARPQR